MKLKAISNGSAVEDRYFISIIIPGTDTPRSMNVALMDNMVVNQLVNPMFELSPEAQQSFQFFVFMGPKSMDLLSSLGHDIGKALNFGFFNVIAKPCLWFMNKIYSVIPNYGIAIILLTICYENHLMAIGQQELQVHE